MIDKPLVTLSNSKSFNLVINNHFQIEDLYMKAIIKLKVKSYILNIITFGCCYQLLKQKYANKIKILKNELKTLRIINKEKCDNENDIIAKAETVIADNTETNYLQSIGVVTNKMPKVKKNQIKQNYDAINYLDVNNDDHQLNLQKKPKIVAHQEII